MCLQAQYIDDDNSGFGRVRQACGISNEDGGVGRGQGICDAPEGLEITTEAKWDQLQAQGIYDNNEGVGGGQTSRPRDRRQQQRRQKIDDGTGGLSKTTKC